MLLKYNQVDKLESITFEPDYHLRDKYDINKIIGYIMDCPLIRYSKLENYNVEN